MLNLDRILNQDRLTRAITGLNRKAFEELLPSFTAAYQQSLVKPSRDPSTCPRSRTQGDLEHHARETALHLAVLQMLSHLRSTERVGLTLTAPVPMIGCIGCYRF
jgi:hypothetical protein